MIVRQEQDGAFAKTASGEFQQRMESHLREHFPFHSKLWGPVTTATVTKAAIAKAESFGFATQKQICLYITLVPMLGLHFDRDPLMPWASQVLTDKSIRESGVRAERLVARAMEFLDRCWGPDEEALVKWAGAIREQWPKLLPQVCRLAPEPGCKELFRQCFPEKLALVEEAGLRDAIAEGEKKAQKWGVASAVGVVLMASLVFLLGMGFDEDPQFPMITEVLLAPEAPDLPREKRLYDRIQRLAEAFLLGHGGGQ